MTMLFQTDVVLNLFTSISKNSLGASYNVFSSSLVPACLHVPLIICPKSISKASSSLSALSFFSTQNYHLKTNCGEEKAGRGVWGRVEEGRVKRKGEKDGRRTKERRLGVNAKEMKIRMGGWTWDEGGWGRRTKCSRRIRRKQKWWKRGFVKVLAKFLQL